MVLARYLGNPALTTGAATALWVVASSTGWFTGWLGVAASNLAGLSEAAGQAFYPIVGLVGAEGARTTFSLTSLVWAVLAGFQGAALALAALLSGRGRSLPLAVLWVPAGIAGGALGVLASLTLAARVLPNEGNGGPFLDIMTSAANFAVNGAIYGAATGPVLAALARRLWRAGTRPAGRGGRTGVLRMGAGLGLVLTLGFGMASCYAQALVTGCDDEKAVLEEFPQYGGREIEPEPSPASSSCIVRFFDPDPEEEIFAYYSARLRENGWEVEKEPPPYSEITEPATLQSGETVPAAIRASSILARRGAYIYRVSYSPPRGSDEARVVVSVEEGREPPEQ